MRYILILLLLVGTAYGQSSPTSAKTRFVNGLYVGTKLDSYFNTADSNAIYWRADSVVMAKYKGTARALAFASALGSYKLVADTFFTGGYTTRARTKQQIDSLSNAVANGFVTIGTTQDITGRKSFTQGQIWFASNETGQSVGGTSSGIHFGNTNTLGGTQNIVIGFEALGNGNQGISIGSEARSGSSGASNNISIGQKAGVSLTTGSGNIFVGTGAGRYFGSGSIFNYQTPTNSVLIGNGTAGFSNTDDNTVVIGYNATGNGSNTVTIGNSSVTDNYFSGRLRSAGAILTDQLTGTSANFGGSLGGTVQVGATADKNVSVGIDYIDFKNNGIYTKGRIFADSIGFNNGGSSYGSQYFNAGTAGTIMPSLSLRKMLTPLTDVRQKSDTVSILLDSNNNILMIPAKSGAMQTNLMSNAGSPILRHYRYNGTWDSKTVVLSGESIGQFAGAGFDGTTTFNSSGLVNIVATENFTSTAKGTSVTFFTTANGTTTLSEKGRFAPDGTFLVNTTTFDGVNKVISNGSVLSTQYRLSALNTAPSSASDTGTLGEIRIDADYIYICTATNTWKRVAIATW